MLAVSLCGKLLNREIESMPKDIAICFQTSSTIKRSLEKIAREEGRSVSEITESIISQYLKSKKGFHGVFKNRRMFERKKVSLPGIIGTHQWQLREYRQITILDISPGGIRLSIPKVPALKPLSVEAKSEFVIIFSLPYNPWPVNLRLHPKRVSESAEEILIGAVFVNPEASSYSALQRYVTLPACPSNLPSLVHLTKL